MRLWRRLTGAGLTCRVLLYTSDSMLIVAHSQLLRAAPGSQQQVHSFLIGRSLCASIRSLCLRTPHTAPRHVISPHCSLLVLQISPSLPIILCKALLIAHCLYSSTCQNSGRLPLTNIDPPVGIPLSC